MDKSRSPDGLSIGELAGIAGVSPRAIRHYHSVGLLREPSRDSAGYRRYVAGDVVDLVRIVRLRAVGLPIAQIARHVGSDGAEQSVADSLQLLARDIDREIARLAAMRDRIRELADTSTFDQPAAALTQALRDGGRLGPDETLPAAEVEAAALVDALHPGGISAVLEQISPVLDSPAAATRFGDVLRRFRSLTGQSPDSEVDVLARDAAAVLGALPRTAQPIDLALMDEMTGVRLNGGQRRFMRRLREVGNGE